MVVATETVVVVMDVVDVVVTTDGTVVKATIVKATVVVGAAVVVGSTVTGG